MFEASVAAVAADDGLVGLYIQTYGATFVNIDSGWGLPAPGAVDDISAASWLTVDIVEEAL